MEPTIENGTSAADAKSKTPRIRSVAYPSNTIFHCVGLTEKINRVFGNISYNTRESLSKKLNISDSHLQTQLSSCVQYGLLELKPKEGYRSTTLFTKIYKPLPEERKEDGLKECFQNPELYKQIFEDCNGKLLTVDGLSTILYRKHKVSEGASALAAKVFIENATELGYINSDSILNINAISVTVEEFVALGDNSNSGNSHEQILYLPPTEEKPKKENEVEVSEIPPIPIFLDNGGVAKLYMPKGFSKQDLERVAKVLKAYVE